jgi:methylenetetrahydrofolate reductase (NADPH)
MMGAQSLRRVVSTTLTAMAHYGGGGRPAHLVASIPASLAQPRPSISFEFFPPKDDDSEAQLWTAIRHLERVRPAFVSVTYGAGGTTQDRTVRVTGRIADETTLTPLAHLTCVGASVRQVRQVVGAYAASGVRNILALRGDPPGNVRGQWAPHAEGLDHADQLVSLIRGLGDFTVGVAAFPDVHPDSPDLGHDVDVLVRKADAGASFAITQMVFDADSYLRLRDLVAARRDIPITPGLMPVTNLRQIQRMSELMGTPLPPVVVARLEAVKDDPAAVRSVGVEIATEIGQRMLDEGAPGIHFITMNRSTATLEVHDNLAL